tara:strand:- start:558 stop:1619 length:1062 start_codon:yes stop_codon:yes gene_type:complete
MKYLKSYINAIKYIKDIATFKEENISSLKFADEKYEGLDGSETIVRIFKTNNINAQSVIIFPGASPYAENHPGMIMLGNALRNIGYNVYLPRIPSLKKLILEKENIDWFAHCYQELVNNKIQNKENIMIVGLSYGGASLLRATLDKRMQNPKPKSILSYGTYFSIDTALDFFMTGVINYNNKKFKIKPHEWGPIVVFYNFINTIETSYDSKKLKRVFKLRIEDEDSLLKKEIELLNDKEQELVNNVLNGKLTTEIKDLIDDMIKQNRELLEYLSPKNWINQINDHVFIMHGANDSMVPFTESLHLHKNLNKSTMLLSFLYEHKEISSNRNVFFKIKEFLKLIHFQAKYLRYNL